MSRKGVYNHDHTTVHILQREHKLYLLDEISLYIYGYYDDRSIVNKDTAAWSKLAWADQTTDQTYHYISLHYIIYIRAANKWPHMMFLGFSALVKKRHSDLQ